MIGDLEVLEISAGIVSRFRRAVVEIELDTVVKPRFAGLLR